MRVGKGPRIRLKDTYGTPEFDAAYRAALSGEAVPTPTAKGPGSGTLAWLVERYRGSVAWAELSPATRKLRERIFLASLEKGGGMPARAVAPKHIQAGLDARRATPFQATKFLDAMRGLFKWALEAKHVAVDPTFGIRARKPKTEGFQGVVRGRGRDV